MSGMTPVAAPSPGGAGGGLGSGNRTRAVESSGTWRLTDRLGLAVAWSLGLLFCAILAAIFVFLVIQGVRYLHPDMLWTNPQVGFTQNETGGFLAPMIGTLLVTAIAMAIAVPIGVGVAVWLSEYARPAPLARVVESTVEMLAGAPSVVLALFGLLLFETPLLGFVSEANHGIVYGKSFLAAGPILALVGLPYVVGTTREGLQAIPNHVREASYAVGKTKIATIRRVLLPAARPSVITGSSLGASHAIGDTAIILLVLGDTTPWNHVGSVPLLGTLRGTGTTLTSYIWDNAPTGDLNQPQKAYAAALVLLLMVLALNLIIDVFGRRARDLRWS
jgi:phosphate transport system permease protein